LRLTQRGIRLLIASTAAALIGAITGDWILTAAPAAALLAIALDATTAELRASRVSRAPTSQPISLTLRAGDSKIIELQAPNPMEMRPRREAWYKVAQNPSRSSLSIEVNPKISGLYRLDGLGAEVKGVLGLTEAAAKLPIDLEVKAYPRVLPWIVEAARFLRTGTAGPGEATGRRRGMGTEYFGTREYYPGDPLKQIEWKATARLSKLMVKEYLEELQGAPHIIYDQRSPGPITADKLAELFLSTTIGAASMGGPIGLTIKSGMEQEFHGEDLEPREAIEVALAHILEKGFAEIESIYELVEPEPLRVLMKTLEKARARGLTRLRSKAMERRIPTWLRLIARRPGPTLDLAYIGNIIYDAAPLIELVEEARIRDHKVRIISPADPWLDSKNLEEAYTTYYSFKKILNALQKSGAEIKLSKP